MSVIAMSPVNPSHWSRAVDVTFVFVPALVLLPFTLLGSLLGGAILTHLPMLSERSSGWLMLLAPLYVLLGVGGWVALITAVTRRWQGTLRGNLWLRLGLLGGVLGSLVMIGTFVEELGRGAPTLLELAWGTVVTAPAVMCLVYLYRISGGRS
ncbi:hypothetical protein GCM10008959_11940 [Deinococcus seoulensis]|uniref:Transmembrane protein n=1 Tax=Deinococcus seoulensis TaxID=1837379 RepID=A0ABQ2RNE8_9DEIO|nr:hypothetical protein [Deinococcus seoulensis]GGR52189.1 hypothetical protein GCM10008959_11940 [Deinococcus seoulensis]